MTILTTLGISYDWAAGNPIDVELYNRQVDVTRRISYWEDTPLRTLVRQGERPINRHFEWLLDTRTAPTGVVAGIEGGAPTTRRTYQPDFLSAGLHYAFSEIYGMTGTAMALPNIFAPNDNMEYQRAKIAMDFVEQLEVNAWWSTFQRGTATDGMGAGTARRQAGLIQWLATTGAHRNAGTTVDITGTTVPAYGNAFLHDFGATPMTVTALSEAVRPAKEAGAPMKEWGLFCGTEVKQFIDGLMLTQVVDVSTAAATEAASLRYTRSMDSGLVGQTVELIRTSWGTFPVFVVKHLNSGFSMSIDLTGSSNDYTVQGENVMLALPMGRLDWRTLRSMDPLELNPGSGDHRQFYFVNEEAICPGNPADCQIFLGVRGTVA